MQFKQKVLIIALIAAAGSTYADINYRWTSDPVLGSYYQQTNGESSYQVSPDGLVRESHSINDSLYSNDIVTSTAKAKVGQITSQGQSYQQYAYDETRRAAVNESYNYSSDKAAADELTHRESLYSAEYSTGNVTRQANTTVRLDSTGKEIANSEQRTTDTLFNFSADDLTKVKGANSSSNSSYQSNIRYAADQALDTVNISKNQNSNYSSVQKLDAFGQVVLENGQPVYIANGQDYQNQSKSSVYKTALNADGKTVSRDIGHIVNRLDESSERNSTNVDYARDDQGKVIGILLSADKKYLAKESTVGTEKVTSSSQQMINDDLAAVKEFRNSQNMNNSEKVSVWDGFSYKNQSSNENSYTKYQDGASTQGTEKLQKNIESSTDRVFKKDQQNALILDGNNQPQVAYTTIKKSSDETYTSDYQPSHYTSGSKQGQDFTILDNGQNSRSVNASTQKIQAKATSSETKKYGDGFIATANSDVQMNTTYQRSLQENIEVNRQLDRKLNLDSLQLTTRTVSTENSDTAPVYKAGSVHTTISNDPNSWSGFNVNAGQNIEQSLVRSWVDEKGIQRYYAVLGTDMNGKEIRSEVSLQKPAGQNKNIELDTISTNKRSENAQENVNFGQEVAYNFLESEKTQSSETSKDNGALYQSNSTEKDRSVKLYSAGMNALDREVQQSYKNTGMGTELILNDQGHVAVKATHFSDSAGQSSLLQYQQNQEKVWSSSNETSSTLKSLDANGQIQRYENSNDKKNITQYTLGKNELDRTYSGNSSHMEKNKQTVTVKTPNYGVDEQGIALSTTGGVLAIDETGQQVKSTQNVKSTVSDVVSQSASDHKVDEKVYQSGAMAYQKSEQLNMSQQYQYADGYVEKTDVQSSQEVKLYNHDMSDKYRDAASSYIKTANGQITDFNEAGEQLITGTLETSLSDKTTAIDYQQGKNLLLSSKNSISEGSSKQVTLDSVEERKVSLANDQLIYQADQKIANENTTLSRTEEKVSHTDQTGYTYATSGYSKDTVNNTKMGLLASQDIYSVNKSENTESLKSTANGKAIDSTIIRGAETVNRTDYSQEFKRYGSELGLNSDGSSVSFSKTVIGVQDKFGLNESTSASQSKTEMSKDGSASTIVNTRVDNITGLTLTQENSGKTLSGQETKFSTSTTIKAGEIATGNVKLTEHGVNAGGKVISNVANGVADSDAVNMGQMKSYSADLNRRFDDFEAVAYRGIAISLAAQQPVPNMRPGQVAVFGGMGHYEGQSAGALGVTSVLEDGRTSFSGAFGIAGGGELGGRVGISYVFGGK